MIYSQNDEEAAILEAVADIPTGRFLDIGAYDGITFSNTLALAEKGWNGVCIEPGLTAFQKLMETHRDRPAVELVHAVVGIYAMSLVEFFDCGDVYSTTELRNREKWKDRAAFRRYLIPQIGLYDCPVLYNPFHVVSIDTEGTSIELMTALLTRCADGRDLPRVVCVEHDGQSIDKTASFYGYQITYKSPENYVLVRR